MRLIISELSNVFLLGAFTCVISLLAGYVIKIVYMCTVEGRYCERHSTYCEFAGNEGCLNGATCVNQDDGYVCQCAAGFAGQFCIFSIFHCKMPIISEDAVLEVVMSLQPMLQWMHYVFALSTAAFVHSIFHLIPSLPPLGHI